MESISEPYTLAYPRICAMADPSGGRVELVEFFDCIGGAMWVKKHYAQSPLVKEVRTIGSTNRYMLQNGELELALEGSRFPAGISAVHVGDTTISVSYVGLGGGGVGAAASRSAAQGLISSRSDPSGGGKTAGSTVVLPRMSRLIIGVDDTDTPREGATWTLAHNICRAIEDDHCVYLSHTIVQLFPVSYRTKNCVAIACEFATDRPEETTGRFARLLSRYTLSEETGMAAYTGFDPSGLLDFGWAVKSGEVDASAVLQLGNSDLSLIMKGRGLTGAVAAIPFATRFDEALRLCTGSP